MIPKIQPTHLQKPAYIYIRQSTMAQVRHHQESTERQYALKDKAMALGWPAEMILILDRDLGLSGAQANGRGDFQRLVADVSMRKVGAVFSLEASRLSRSSADWHRLLELCAFTDTVIIDEDGSYNLADFNDQLLLGLKGTMSHAELHFLRARLQGGKRNKAQKGDLRSPLPVDFVHDEDGRIVFDPDSQVQHAVHFLFDSFRRKGSAYGVAHCFSKAGLQFPKRAYGGVWNGRLIWGRLTGSRVLGVLKNPVYAGAYVHGRYQSIKEITPEGALFSRVKKMPISDWTVLIQDHHEGYISWEDFMQNQQLLERNRTNADETLLGGAAREGLALLQGLLLCGHCGRRITVRYKGNGGIYPTYECNWRRREALSSYGCLHLRCDLVDQSVISRVLEIIRPKQIEIAIKAMEELQKRQNSIDTQWQMKIERAQYEAHLAQRRYEEVDPANRLVAATLERRWNKALTKLEETKEIFSQHQRQEGIAVTDEQKAELRTLARDLPRLWKAPTTKAKDRKRILRLLIKDITIENLPTPKQVVLHVRWQGGLVEDIPIITPPNYADKIRYPKEIVERIRMLIKNNTDAQIASTFNQEKIKSANGSTFTPNIIRWIRYKHRIQKPSFKDPKELTVTEIAKKFDVSRHVVYYWIERKIIT
ncbi:MAG: recombinase family protein, partial [Deltaproteobacteria bacterium]|nr:recombinase family protein [Deltaproteobacteria bacterium]